MPLGAGDGAARGGLADVDGHADHGQDRLARCVE